MPRIDPNQRDDPAALLGAYRTGDASALPVLIDKYKRSMAGAARRYLTEPADVEDAVQEAWALFTRHQHTIRHPERLGGWLGVTTARAALTMALRTAKSEPMANIDDLGVSASHFDELDDAENGPVALHAAIARLSESDRSLVEMLLDDPDVSYAELADRWGRPVGSIGPTRGRVLAKLRRDPAIRQLASARTA